MEYLYGHSCPFISVCVQTGAKRVLFDAVKEGQIISPKWVAPEEEQESNESRRWVPLGLVSLHQSFILLGFGNADYGQH